MSGWEPPLTSYSYKYMWMTRGENCPLCDAMAGRVYELDKYITSTVYPGFHKNCDCYLALVPFETIESDPDIFGSSLDMLNDSWLGFLSFPSLDLFREMMKICQPGMTAPEAINILKSKENDTGMFTNIGNFAGVDPSWAVFWSGSPDLYQSFSDIMHQIVERALIPDIRIFGPPAFLTSLIGMFLGPKPLHPYWPKQTYHNPYYQKPREPYPYDWHWG